MSISHEARELVLFGHDGYEPTYKHAMQIATMLGRRSDYDPTKALIVWKRWVDEVAKAYARVNLGHPSEWNRVFSPKARLEAAKEIERKLRPAARRNPRDKSHFKLVLPQEVVSSLFEWHGGQSTPTYSLASTGMNHTVSVAMIEKAITELQRVRRTLKTAKLKKDINWLIGELDTIASYPEEFAYDE